ncbi:Ohr subfamily peroxiredoxin [Paenibacillus sambharensis]|uniref:Ohr subfamily peroxiredoxin n=1 Tax=Paenibacillus sambharensis TaxID=1803190 RepID=A0A2W1LDX3_9BACL|nr:organic hydroperoxide resistance protein [Paenibacillus sambharensis]PZD97003.1 Ohr subfamily peroxiredoxin [Paenibacillus sambharensis]
MNPLYTAEVTAKGGREGQVVSSDGIINLDVKMPKSLGGAGGEGTNPEQLFAAGYAACFDSALNLVIRNKKIQGVQGTKVTAKVSILKDETDNGFKLEVELNAKVDGVDRQTAQDLIEQAHQVCPYSKATRGNIKVNLQAEE